MDIKETLSIRLRKLLAENNMTQYELSKKSTVTEATISNFLNCKQLPKLEVVSKIADVFGVSVDYLLGRSDIKFTNQQHKNDILYATHINTDYTKLSKDEQEEIKQDVQNYADYVIKKHLNKKK